MTLDELEALETAPTQTLAPTPANAPAPGGMTVDQLDSLEGAAPAAPPVAVQPVATPAEAPPKVTANGNEISPAGQVGGAILTGAAKSIYETKDFIFGKTPESEKSDTRRSIESFDKELGAASMGNSFVSGLSQFATGMLGAGKLVAGAKLVPGVGGAIGSAQATKTGAAVFESAKAATVGAVAFDPNGPRLSDLVQQFPALQNPVTEFLASKPGDSAALGRAKNALESIGVDAALAGVFAASVAGFKALKSGDAAAVQASNQELASALAHKDAKLAISKGDNETAASILEAHPEQVAAAEEALFPTTVIGEMRYRGEPLPNSGVAPANMAADGTIYVGPKNGVHFQIAEKFDFQARGEWKDTGFVTPDGQFLNRADAFKWVAENEKAVKASENMGAELDAMDYREQVPEAARKRATADPAPVSTKDVGQQAAQATQQGDAPAVQVQRVDSPTQGAGPEGLPAKPRLMDVSEEQLTRFITQGQADTAALLGPGGWEGAVERGYVFGDGGSIPWQKLARAPEGGADPLDFMLARVADQFKEPLDKLKGGVDGVLSDPAVLRLRDQRVALFNEDPQAFMGALQVAGANARTMVVNMEAAQLLANRAMLDTLNLRSRIGLGMLNEFGGDLKAGRAALEDHLSIAATLWGQAQTMRASAGRALRRNRAEFAFTPDDLAAMKGLDDAKFFNLLDAVGHDFQVAQKLVKPGFWSRLKDDAAYLYVNNLLWGLRTHFVNLSTNSYMLMGRPAERMLGFAAKGDRAGVAENWRQYGYMGGSLIDSFREAARAWKIGDSVMAPHSVEVNPQGVAEAGRGTNWAAEGWRQWDSIPNVTANAYTGLMKGLGLPTRSLGAVDELVKQVVYRSKVQSAALSEGIERGLEGQALTDHVHQALLASFDDAGQAIDLRALDEANIATFQQDLLEGTIGRTMQTTVANHQMLRFVLPFVKTPTNVIRMGVKLTPGLNMLQQEYRQMVRGQMGEEKQAQAIGQMAMGSLFLGSAAFLATQGYITGGGPSDPKLMSELKATGWQPYSFVVSNKDGSKTYVNFGRYDPIAMPFGIVADTIDILSRDQDGDGAGERAMNAITGLAVALAKQMSQKSYLTSLHDTLDAIMDPDRNAAKVLGGMAANFVPASSGLRFWNTDPHMRDARGITDKVLATVPGLSSTLPPKRDVFGDPLTVHKGLWVDGEKTAVDAEVRRMIDESGVMFGPPGYARNGVDLREVSLKDGRNAYDVLQELSGHPKRGPSLKDTVGRLMKTSAYQQAPDGDAETRGTKLAMLAGTLSKYREAAWKQVRADENVRAALGKRDAEARAAYAKKSSPTNQESGANALSNIGKAVGVDLSAVLPQ